MPNEKRHKTVTACAEDHELLALAAGEELDDHVREHIESCEECAQRLQQISSEMITLQGAVAETTDWKVNTATKVPSEKNEPSLSPHATATAPVEQIGRYKVIGLLGGGGQADVYRVVHPVLQRVYVLKLSRRLTRPGSRDHLVREGKMLAALDHPNLARVVDLDFHEGRAFIVMDFVPGRNLRQFMAGRSIPPQEAARLLSKVAGALVPAHAAGILHLDLKPENIVIGDDGEPRVIDFGLALMRDAWQPDDNDPGVVSGTVEYMPPEQANAQHDRLGPPADVFAIGAMLYELLLGSPPYWGGESVERWERAQSCDIDRTVVERAPVPAVLRRICLKALEREPEDRYQSTEVLARELQGAAQGPRHFGGWVAAMVAILLVAAGFSFWPNKNSPETAAPPKMVDLPLQNFLRVDSGTTAFELSDFVQAIPLWTGDGIELRCFAPRDMNTAVFWLSSDGSLQLVPTSATNDEWQGQPVQLLEFSEEIGRQFMQKPTGTELIVLCASDDALPADDEILSLFNGVLNDAWNKTYLPDAPSRTALQFDNDQRVTRLTGSKKNAVRGFGAATPDVDQSAIVVIEKKLEQLRVILNEEFDFHAGIAFPHVPQISDSDE